MYWARAVEKAKAEKLDVVQELADGNFKIEESGDGFYIFFPSVRLRRKISTSFERESLLQWQFSVDCQRYASHFSFDEGFGLVSALRRALVQWAKGRLLREKRRVENVEI